MRLATIATGAGPRPAAVVGKRVLDITVDWNADSPPPRCLLDVISGGKALLALLQRKIESADERAWRPLEDVSLLAPVPRPPKNVVCVGRNYKLHVEEGARARGVPVEYPKVPEFFTKPPTAVVGTGADIELPDITTKLDYEVELAFVVGQTARNIRADDALDYIFGVTVLNDVTARDLQRSHGQWFKGKGLDTSCPIGPWIVTMDEFDLRAGHRLWLTVNGELRQDSITSDMIFDCARILESLSAGMTVEAGDIVTTGTPSGVGLGLDPQIWLKDGDVIEAGIDGIGSITNRVRAV
ncbi:2-keto-4-pentenoate hydratase/2-oxohepta-3-ene-1,7-dioic acid hydratase in catechol pathway [Hyphomicrobiales bacterium]|nr:2-keto-4-pentenoate hydratase/2-oxohepta-3-ene-1,7-dioic acid hydratase in catechol pathway [Hyphomicrobiales bacterium]CAH1692178.1 2-keto-4-pentenoate hydratase/2-oxohepta-3-ene-1,7-dioic acid hydratase in catechol pathway [Hyphomicrobiales bacterium]